jgi:hypothetical protein
MNLNVTDDFTGWDALGQAHSRYSERHPRHTGDDAGDGV